MKKRSTELHDHYPIVITTTIYEFPIAVILSGKEQAYTH